ncbi:MAG: asparagine synthase (glutamine-hydrolyzing) [Acidobacteriota bacterium]
MCGIAGVVSLNPDAYWQSSIRSMIATLSHRGPDDEGYWHDSEAGVTLGHRRLAIVDLSPEGHQPMASPSGRFEMSFNGEIYNFVDLRNELEARGCGFRGHSDTEVMLAAFEEWGVPNAVERFVGMFAFAVVDRQERLLYLVRDRLGEKPLYYGWAGEAFLFASELKAMRAHPAWRGVINRNALALFMRYGYIVAPQSIYEGVSKLLPGAILTLPLRSRRETAPTVTRYWSAQLVAEAGLAAPFTGDIREATDVLEKLLRNAIRGQMVADVPLGAFLSGGIDSSTIVALMQAMSNQPVKTFTIGFNENGFNEAGHAKAVASHLGTEHTELYVTAQDAMAVIPQLASIYDEPFADSSQIPTFLLAKLARDQVTVSLSGDAADELFSGYTRYEIGQGIWNRINRLPLGSRKLLARASRALPASAWNGFLNVASPFLSRQYHLTADRLRKLADALDEPTPELLYRHLVSIWKDTAALVPNSLEPQTAFTDEALVRRVKDFGEHMMLVDQVSYLPDDILAKVDRASMWTSLESRVPFLDHRIVEFAWRLPMAMKHRNGQGKWLLRQVLYRYVPRDLVERPKMGFGVPIGDWLRGPLRDWAEELLDERRLRDEGLLNTVMIRQTWDEHLSGKRNWQYYLWNILIFEAWLAEQAGITRLGASALSAA